MKKWINPLLTALLLCYMALPIAAAETVPVEVDSGAAILMDAGTGQVLYSKNIYQKVYPASTTKILTALLACEICDPDETLTVSESAIAIDEWNSASIDLLAGEELSVRDALYGLMLPSANDAANALAEHAAGSQEAFVELMNRSAWQIGAFNTHFSNAHGLHDPGHYTTAYDMALITQHAVQNADFMQYFGAAAHTMGATNLQPLEREFTNYQSMLVEETDFYEPAVLGGKIGYTEAAGHTMSTIAEKDGRTLICVVMDSGRTEKFTDTAALLAYGFEQFRPVTLSAGRFLTDAIPLGEGEVSFYSETDFTALLRSDFGEERVLIGYQLPDSFAAGDRLPTSVELYLPSNDPTLPDLLGAQPLFFELSLPVETVPVSLPSSHQPQAVADAYPPFLIAGALFLLLLFVFFVVARYFRMRRRRRIRLARMNERMRRRSA